MVRPAAILLLWPAALAADDLRLSLPIACTVGETCHIQQGFDHDPGPGAADFACGTLSYDGHDGTDFALPTLAVQAAGVAVLAAADGTVAGVRDEMPDILQGTPGAPDVTGRECGNGVLIRHAGGWETQYCHLALGSVLVAPGQVVSAGTPVGRVGLSGQTQFPHVHLSVRRGGEEVDPFAPASTGTCGAPDGQTLWVDPPPFPPGGILDAGWSDQVPDYDAVKAGTAGTVLSTDSAALVVFALLFGGRAGDEVRITVTGPAGVIVDHAESLERTQAQLFRAAGLRRPDGGWSPGAYAADVTLTRGDVEIDRMTLRLDLS